MTWSASFGCGISHRNEEHLIFIPVDAYGTAGFKRWAARNKEWHIEQTAEAGAAYDEVLEAVEVGIEMGGGPATVSARFALQVMDAVFG